jgi:hypothetical protein
MRSPFPNLLMALARLFKISAPAKFMLQKKKKET